MRPRDIIQAIEEARDGLRKSERKVADYVLARPEEAIHMRIVDLAQEARVSEPTVVRFCRAIGCDGFQNFKLALAQHVAHNPRYEGFSLGEHDSARDYTLKVFDTTFDTLRRVRDAIDTEVIERAVSMLTDARRVEFYGFGASAAVAIDAQHKFFRLQIASAACSDPHLQAMAALSLGPEDVVVAISQSGRTRVLVEAMQLVHRAGARLIALAPGGTPVSSASDLPIDITVEETSDHYTPLPSRMAHMVVIDILAVGVAKAKGPAISAHLQQLEQSLESLRAPRHS